MHTDVENVSRFYQSRLGQMAQMCIARRLSALWPDVRGLDVLALGYGTPYIAPWQGSARRLVNAMPARQGVEQWPAAGPVQATLVSPLALPFGANCFDRVLVIHHLEEAMDPAAYLSQIAKTMTANGRMVLVVPHRMGVWSVAARTPFGHGRAFSLLQMRQLLDQAGLQITARTGALFAPPHPFFARKPNALAWERTGEVFWPFLSGAILVEAIKTRMIDPRTPIAQRVFCPEPR